MNGYFLNSKNLSVEALWWWGVRRDGGEVQEDRKLVVQQDIQSPGEKVKADLWDDLIQGYP